MQPGDGDGRAGRVAVPRETDGSPDRGSTSCGSDQTRKTRQCECVGGCSYHLKDSNRNPCPKSHRGRDYLRSLSQRATESACESPPAKLQFSLGNLLFHDTEGFPVAKDLTLTLAVPRGLSGIALQLGRVLHAEGSIQTQLWKEKHINRICCYS